MIFYIFLNPASRYAMLAEFSEFYRYAMLAEFAEFYRYAMLAEFLIPWKLQSYFFGSARQLVASVTSVPKSKQ